MAMTFTAGGNLLPKPYAYHGLMVHLVTILLTMYGVYQQTVNEDFVQHVSKTFAGPLEFLTIIGAILTILYVVFAASSRIYPSLYDLLAVAVSVETGISVVFWGVYAYNPQLLFVSEGSRLKGHTINPIVDICLHLFPAIGLLLEFFLHIRYPMHRYRRHQRLISLFCLGYCMWVTFLRWKNGAWVYPVIELLPPRLVPVVFLLGTFLANAIFSQLVAFKAGKEQ